MASVIDRLRNETALARMEIRTGRFQRSMALITGFSAVVSGFESYVQHDRGAFANPLMWTPVALTPPTAAAAGAALVSERAARKVLPALAVATLADGLLGFVLHVRGIERMPGGLETGQYNVVMGPPVFAPLLMCTVGVTGVLTGLLRREEARVEPWSRPPIAPVMNALARQVESRGVRQRVAGAVAQGRFEREMAITSACFGILAGGEAYFEHLRGSFNQWAMWTPVWVTPPMVAAAVGAVASERVARNVLPFTSAVTFLDGAVGFGLHLRGIRDMPGGFSNLRFNVTLGPPLFAPLLFTAVGLTGFIASLLRRRSD
ncbi:MAG TPA: hypothetical protein VH482_36035 [Thermomicrobiales bacterium]|jgi:hypothetical protein